MEKFGNSDSFAIWVDYYYERYKDDPEFKEFGPKYKSGGHVYFWVNGKNLFEIAHKGKYSTFSGDVDVVADFFCRHLLRHITDDPFPVLVKAKTGIDMMEEIKLIDGPDDDIHKYAHIDWDNIDMDERDKIDMWNYHHGMLTNNGGFFLPNSYIRKVGNKIEYSWKDDYPKISLDGEHFFKYPKGVEYIDLKIFKDVTVAFCLDYIERFKDIYPLLCECREELQKAIDVKIC